MDIRQNDYFRFESPILLFGASPLDASVLKLAQNCQGWPVLAADGGVTAAKNAGLLPQTVIGDMDSVTNLDQLPASVRQIRLSGQNDTDFEKCLELIDAPLIVGLGFLDGRIDHSLAALDVLARLRHDWPVLLAGTHDVLVRVKGDFKMTLDRGSRISIWPLGCQHFIRSVGLVWSLDNLTMRVGLRTGTSNQASADEISITAGEGDGYAVIVPFAAFDMILNAVL